MERELREEVNYANSNYSVHVPFPTDQPKPEQALLNKQWGILPSLLSRDYGLEALLAPHPFLTPPLEPGCKPIARLNLRCLSCGRALVKISATISSVGYHTTVHSPV